MKAAVVAAALCLVSACSLSNGTAGTSESPAPTSAAQLDGQVVMPPSFPHDVPIYPKARLTAAAGFPSSGPTSWGLEWETTDSLAKVRAYYQTNLNKGDWTITFNATTSDAFAATFARKSDRNVNGTLAASSAGGVTKIQMSLLSPPAS